MGRCPSRLDSRNTRQDSRNVPTLYAWRVVLAVTYLESNRPVDALRKFESLAERDFAPIPWNEVGAITLCLLAELCAYFDDRRRASLLYAHPPAPTSRWSDLHQSFAARSHSSLALLAATLERHEDAAAHFEYAMRQNVRVGAPPFVAQTQYDYARFFLRTRAAPADRQRATSLVSEALGTATHLDLPRLRGKLLALQSEFTLRSAEVF